MKQATEKLGELLAINPAYPNARFELGRVSVVMAMMIHEDLVEAAEDAAEDEDEDEDENEGHTLVVPPSADEEAHLNKGIEYCQEASASLPFFANLIEGTGGLNPSCDSPGHQDPRQRRVEQNGSSERVFREPD